MDNQSTDQCVDWTYTHRRYVNDAEYDLYTSSLDDLAESYTTNDDETNRSYDDAYFDRQVSAG